MDLLVHDGVAADPAANLALEEALARAGPPRPVLRLWRNASCVVTGRTLLVTTPGARVPAFLTPPPPDRRPADSRRGPVASLRERGQPVSIPGAARAVTARAVARYGALSRRPPSDTERRWQERLLSQRYRTESWHLTGRTEGTSGRQDPT